MLQSGTFYVIKNNTTNMFYDKTTSPWASRLRWTGTLNKDCIFFTTKKADQFIRKRHHLKGADITIVEFSYCPTDADPRGIIDNVDLFRGLPRKIYKDTHSLYVRFENSIYRPTPSTQVPTGSCNNVHLASLATTWAAKGDTFSVASGGQVLASRYDAVKGQIDERVEQWYNHGAARVWHENPDGLNEVETIPVSKCWIPNTFGK